MDQRDAVPLLTDEQIRHFKREGYVICYGLLPEELMAACRQRLWQDPPTSMRANDPTSWLGPLATKDETGSGMHGIAANSRSGYIWKERVAGGEQLMLDLLPKRLAPIAEQLLGPGVYPPTGESVGAMLGVPDDQHFPAELDRVARSSDIGISPLCARFLSLIHTHNFPVPLPPEAKLHDMFVVGSRARGIYATLPQQPGTQRPFVTGGGHNDGHPFQLGVEAYIDDVPPNGGGFQYWPKAHRRLFPHYLRQHSRDPVDTTSSGAWGTAPSSVIQQIAQDTQPVDCYGPAGTCIFWHHRGMHAAGKNFSERLRLAVLHEWAKTDINDGPPPGSKADPEADMWRDWSAQTKTIGPEFQVIRDDESKLLPAAQVGTHEARVHTREDHDRMQRRTSDRGANAKL